MSIRAIYRYLFILTFSVALCGAGKVWAQADTTSADSTDEPAKKKVLASGHQLCIGVDILHPILNNFVKNKATWEIEAHYYLKNEFYGVAEGGWGGSDVTYTDLQYTTTNNFLRLGFNKSILARDGPDDWDMMFMGMRIGYAGVKRTAGTYTVIDSVWGNSTGTTDSKNFPVLWAELTGGMRVELLRGLMAGWNLRGKFLMNGKSFKDLAPLNIAGYGRGDKNAAFDFNVYVSYAIRWRKKLEIPPAKTRPVPGTPPAKTTE